MAAEERDAPSQAALQNLAKTVRENLELEKDWTAVEIHPVAAPASAASAGAPDARPLLHGLPPRRMYVHPDEQIAIIRAEKERGGERIPQPPEAEWVLPMHLNEKWSMARFAAVFDSIDAIPPSAAQGEDGEQDVGGGSAAQQLDADADSELWKQWRGPKRGKRIILAIVQDDSTVSYYAMHDGIVKPRQN